MVKVVNAAARLAAHSLLPPSSSQVGSAWGGLLGIMVRAWLPTWNVQPGVYALMAATGVLGGVFRSAMSLVALVIEGSHGIEFLFGVVLSVIIANWVAHHIHHDGERCPQDWVLDNYCLLLVLNSVA